MSYAENRTLAFEQLGINPNDRRYNCHHIIQKKDKKNGLAQGIDIDDVANLLPLPIEEHNFLHKYLDTHYEVNTISMRVNIANIIYNGDECDYETQEYPEGRIHRPLKVRKTEVIEHRPKRVKNKPDRYYFDPLDIDGDLHFRKRK
jgi:hypothetical protein